MSNNYNTPVNRNSIFYSNNEFNFENELVLNYMIEDTGQTVILYEVDREKTQVNDIYHETKNGVRFKPPKELPCLYEISESQMKSYDSKTNNGAFSIGGNLNFTILLKTLEMYKCDINRGDYIGILVSDNKMVYYSVVDDGKVNTANNLNIGAFKTAFRKIKCTTITNDEFNGK